MNNNAVKYTDPSGHEAKEDSDGKGFFHRTSEEKLQYIAVSAKKYGIKLPNRTWDIYPNSAINTFYGFTPLGDGVDQFGTQLDGDKVYIEDDAFQNLNEKDFAGILVHEARHAWQQFHNNNNGDPYNINLPPLEPASPQFQSGAYVVEAEADAYSVESTFLRSLGISSGGNYDYVVEQRDYFRAQMKTFASPLGDPIPLPFCEPLWCQ